MKPSLDSVCTGGGGGFTPWMNCQDMVEASTHGGADASLLSKQLDRVLSLVDSLRTAARVRLSAISSTEEALRNLGTFSFVALHFWSEVGRHSSTIAEFLRLIKRLEELHTEVLGMISSPYLATILLLDASWRWSLYLFRCVAASVSESMDAPGCHASFLLEPILAKLEGWWYVGPILPALLADLFHKTGVRGGGGGGGGGDGSATAHKWKASTTGGGRARVRVRYFAHLPALSLRDGENSRSILAGTLPPPPYMVKLCARTSTCVGCAGRDTSGNNCMSLPPQR